MLECLPNDAYDLVLLLVVDAREAGQRERAGVAGLGDRQ
jgi:hypothetical protein